MGHPTRPHSLPSLRLDAPWKPNPYVYMSLGQGLKSSCLSQIRHLNTQTVTRCHHDLDRVPKALFNQAERSGNKGRKLVAL